VLAKAAMKVARYSIDTTFLYLASIPCSSGVSVFADV
jgi:hypothetical protein